MVESLFFAMAVIPTAAIYGLVLFYLPLAIYHSWRKNERVGAAFLCAIWLGLSGAAGLMVIELYNSSEMNSSARGGLEQ